MHVNLLESSVSTLYYMGGYRTRWHFWKLNFKGCGNNTDHLCSHLIFCWKHGIYKQEKDIWPSMSAFLVHLNPTFLSFHSMTWSLLCWRIYEALLNSFSLLSLSLLLNYLFHIFRALSVQHLLLSLLGLVYVPTSFCLFNMSNLQNKNAGVYKYKLFIPSSTMMIFFPRAGNRVTDIVESEQHFNFSSQRRELKNEK